MVKQNIVFNFESLTLNTLRMKTLTTYFTILTIAMFTFTSCSNDDAVDMNNYGDIEAKAPKKGDQTIAEIVTGNADFAILLAALQYAGLDGVFAGTDQFTVFAPKNDSFVALLGALEIDLTDESGNMKTFDQIFTEVDAKIAPATVGDVLLYHVTEGRRAANSVVPSNNYRTIETLLGASFMVSSSAQIMTGGNANPVDFDLNMIDISASNGIIHVVQAVLLP